MSNMAKQIQLRLLINNTKSSCASAMKRLSTITNNTDYVVQYAEVCNLYKSLKIVIDEGRAELERLKC